MGKAGTLLRGVMLFGAIGLLASGCGASLGGTTRASRPRVEEIVTLADGGLLRLHGSIVRATPEAYLLMTERCGGRRTLLCDDQAVAVRAAALRAKSSTSGAARSPIDPDRDLTYVCLSRAR